jgi:prepilin-type N-terminal cleavage/methylation domain-containing protein
MSGFPYDGLSAKDRACRPGRQDKTDGMIRRRTTMEAKRGNADQEARFGFTMIELMIVISIMGVVLTTSIPLIYHSMRKDPMRKAVADVMEACGDARAQAIMSGMPAELIIRPLDHSLSVSAASTGPAAVRPPVALEDPASAPPPRRQRPPFKATLSSDLVIEMVDVNLREFKDEEEARVRFFPTGRVTNSPLFCSGKGATGEKSLWKSSPASPRWRSSDEANLESEGSQRAPSRIVPD